MEMQTADFDTKVKQLQAEVLELGSRVNLSRKNDESVVKDNA